MKWQTIYHDLLNKIMTGKYAEGERFPSIENLCRIYEPSNITIRRCCTELKKNGWITTLSRRGTFVTRPTDKIRILLCAKLVEQKKNDERLHSIPIRNFYNVIENHLCGIPGEVMLVDPEYVMRYPDSIKDPMIVFHDLFFDLRGMEFKYNFELMDFFYKMFDPLVYGTIPDKRFHQLKINYFQAFRSAVHYLVNKGHCRIGLISHSFTIPGVAERFRGYFSGMEEAGILINANWIKTTPRYDFNHVEDAMKEYTQMTEPPTAIICTSDIKAINAINYCRQHNISVPDDLAIIGFDNHPDGENSIPSLTSFSTITEQTGHYIMDYVKMRRIGQRHESLHLEIKAEFIERNSS